MTRLAAAWYALLNRCNLTAKIWLSIGIFVLGFVFCSAVEQIQGLKAERYLQTASEAMFPAALRGQRAEAAFQRSAKAFSDAAVMQDLPGLDRAGAEGRLVRDILRELAAIRGLSYDDKSEAMRVRAEVERFLSDGLETYGSMAANLGGTGSSTQTKIAELASRSASIKGSLQQLNEHITGELQQQLGLLQARSVDRRWLNLTVLVLTLAAAAMLVNVTIQRSIMPPLMQAQADLAHERDLLRILLDNVPDYIYFKDVESRFIRVNRAESALLGVRTEGEAIGRTDFDFFDDELASKAYQDEREIIRSGLALVSKVERVSSPRSVRWVTSTKVPVKDESGTVQLIVGVSRDCTDWKEAVEAVQKSEEFFRCLFAAIPHAVWVYDAKTLEILEVNPAAVRRYGYSTEEFLALRMPDLYPDEESFRLFRTLESGGPAGSPGVTWKHRTKGCRVLEVQIGVHALDFRGRTAVAAVVQDVTERRQLERDLHQAQRLESVGQLAAGIAHEINTPIQYIGDNLRFLHDAFRDRQMVFELYERLYEATERSVVTPELLADLRKAVGDADLEYLREEIPEAMRQSLDGVERVATIVRAMKEFAHPGHKEKAAADLNKALQNTLLVARNEYKYVADVETVFGDLPPVVCHVADMNQVFLNLLINAAHAIGEVMPRTQMKGKIGVRTWQAGDQAVVAISDTGCGISDKIRDKVFDLFFTTKPVGTGTGQGLAIARSIVVEKHGGTLRFEPNPPQGTTFVVSVPSNPSHGKRT
jgi:two-component system NtrC family sensor kinase